MRRSPLIISVLSLTAGALFTGAVERADAIIGGTPLSPGDLAPGGDYAWLAHLSGPAGGCTGSLVAADWVLTAAHCIPATTVTFGSTADNPIGIVDTVVHPGYDEVNFDSTFDVALVQLASAAGRTPISMAAPSSSLPNGGTVTLAGWGVTSLSGGDPTLPSEVQSQLESVDASLWATGALGMSCFGDSGGPMLRNGELAGVISAGDANCAEFTVGPRVSALRSSFIDPVLGVVAGEPPVALSGELTVAPGDPVLIPLEYSDPDTPSVDLQIVDVGFGALTLDSCTETAPSVCTFLLPEGFIGDTTFTYTVSDGSNTATATWLIHVIDPPQPPVAEGNLAIVTVDVPQLVFLPATDPNDDELTFAIETAPTHGELDDCATGLCTYTPDPGYLGTDEFTYTASDGALTSNVATFTITVIPQQPPVAASYEESVASGVTLEFFLFANDPNNDTLTFDIASPPQHGEVLCSNDSCSYVSDVGYVGDDTVGFTASDADSTSDVGTVTIHVLPSDPPEATDQEQTTKGSPIAISLAAADPEGVPLAFTIVGPPAHGALSDCSTGSCSYTPDAGYTGADAFTWNATDGETDSNTATYSITVVTPTWVVRPVSAAGSAAGLAEIVAGGEGTVAGATLTGDASAAGTFRDPTAATAVTSGVVLGNAPAVDVSGPAIPSSARSILSLPGDDDVAAAAGVPTADATRLQFELTPTDDSVSFTVVFASREYGLSEGTEYNDTAIIVVGGQPCLLPGGLPLSVNGVNLGGIESSPVNEHLFVENFGFTASIDASGFTTAITCTTAVTPGTPVEVVLAIADGTDGSIGSYLLIEGEVPNTTPTAELAASFEGTEGSGVALAATVTDDDGDTPTVAWTYETVSADEGTTCSFDDPAAAAPVFTCSDEGSFTATVTADDGVNEPASATATVEIANVAPTVNLVAPSADAFLYVGLPVTLSVSVSDSGPADSPTCTVDFGDGSTPVAVPVASGGCATEHSYSPPGVVTATFTIDDGDGGVTVVTADLAVGTKHADVVGAVSAPDGDGEGGGDGLRRVATVLLPDSAHLFATDAAGTFRGTALVSAVVDGATATYTVGGEWNGAPGHTADVVVTDGGPGGTDHVRVVVRDGAGAEVHVIEFDAAHGNLQVARVQRRGSPPLMPPRRDG